MQNPIIIGDPKLGGFGGVNYAGSNNDLKYPKSPLAWNWLIGDKGLIMRGGCLKDNAVEIGPGNVGVTGLFHMYDGLKYKTLAKVGTRVYVLETTGQSDYLIQELVLAGNAGNVMSNWNFSGANDGNTNSGVLHWQTTYSAPNRTVEVYKNSDGLAANLVASGSGEVSLTITEAGDTGDILSDWSLTGANFSNTNNGVLYWETTCAEAIRTVEIYKNSDGQADSLVASGTGTVSTTITLNAANASGLSGSVAASDSTAEDTDLANNTLTYQLNTITLIPANNSGVSGTVVTFPNTGDNTDLANNTLTFGVLGATSEIEFESWQGYGWFFEGEDLYKFSTGMAEKVPLLDQDGNPLTGEKPKGRVIFQHNERLILIDGSKVYMSQTDYPDRFKVMDTDPALLRCFQVCDKDDGQDLTGGCSYRKMIIAFKPEKMFIITGDMAFDNMNVDGYAKKGMYDQKSLVECGDGFLRWYGAPDGVYQFSPETGVQHISREIDEELNKIPVELRRLVCGGWDGRNKLYVIFYPFGKDIEYCNRGQAYDPARKEWMPLRDWYVSRMVRFQDTNVLHAGWSTTGHVQALFMGTSDNGSDIEAYYETKFHSADGERYLDELAARVLTDSGVTLGWITDLTSDSIEVAPAGLGDKLADLNDAVPSGFRLSDANDPVPDGSILSDKDEWIVALNKFNPRLRAGIRFNEIKFTFYAKTTDRAQIDYLKAFHYPGRD